MISITKLKQKLITLQYLLWGFFETDRSEKVEQNKRADDS